MTLGRLRRRQDHGRRPVVDSRGVAGGDRAAVANDGFELAESFERGVRPRVLVLLDRDGPALARDLDRDDLFGEIARRHRLAGALLRAQRKSVLGGARDLVFLGHVLAGLRHGIDAV